jgi:arylsulfatase A-like enzyme
MRRMVDRRNVLKLGLAAPTLLARPARARRRRADKPNLIHICADDMRRDDVALMPHARRLFRREGVDFTRHVVPFSLCAPSRASILTGLQPHNHGVVTNRRNGYRTYRSLEDNALPVWLTSAGYHVGHVGKFMNNYGRHDPLHVPPGYADWHAVVNDKTEYYDFTLNENGAVVKYDHGEYATDVFEALALDFLGNAPEPYALFLWPIAPHFPAIPARRDKGSFADVDMPILPSFNEKDVSDKPEAIRGLPPLSDEQIGAIQDLWRSRAETLQAIDRAIAAIVDAVAANGQAGNTHIVFTSDNGFQLGEHRIAEDKDFLYEESVRVPLFWRAPGHMRGAPRGNPVSNLDVTAAFVELAGASAGRALDGTSLLPLLADAKAKWNSATLLQCREAIGLSTQHYRYTEWTATGEVELYDLGRDPYELMNAANDPDYAKTRQSLADALASLKGCAGGSCAWTGRFPHKPR